MRGAICAAMLRLAWRAMLFRHPQKPEPRRGIPLSPSVSAGLHPASTASCARPSTAGWPVHSLTSTPPLVLDIALRLTRPCPLPYTQEPVDWRDMYRDLVARGGVKTVTPEEAYGKARRGWVRLGFWASCFLRQALSRLASNPLAFGPGWGVGMGSNTCPVLLLTPLLCSSRELRCIHVCGSHHKLMLLVVPRAGRLRSPHPARHDLDQDKRPASKE